MLLSIGIVALNEEQFLPNLFKDLINQSYNHSLIEIVLVDSGSNDDTKKIMLDFKEKNLGEFKNIIILDNPKRIQAAGWNVVIKAFSGDALSRIDAHTRIDKDFCKYVVENLENGEYVVGGKRPCLIEHDSKWANTLLQVENSLFGSSILKSRSSNNIQYVRTMFHATYRREIFEKVGLFNEKLLRTEDNEFHYRISKSGYKLLYDPRILSFQFARGSFKKMLKQKYQNGVWIGKTLKICPKCLSLYHFVPFVFVISLIVSIIISIFGLWYFIVALLGLYFVFSILNSIFSGIKNRFYFFHLIMPFLFFFLHVSYGLGTMLGIFKKVR